MKTSNRKNEASRQGRLSGWKGMALCVLLLLSLPGGLAAQDRMAALEQRLDSLSALIPGLSHRSDLALSDVPLSDYVRAIGRVHQVNVYIDDTPAILITNDFTNESVKSIFTFICKKFEYDIEPVGTILNFFPYKAPAKVSPPPKAKLIQVSYADSLLSFDLENDTLDNVLRKVSQLSGRTILTRPGVTGFLSGYIPPGSFDTALENLLFSNGFSIQRSRKGYYIVDAFAQAPSVAGNSRNNAGRGGAKAQSSPAGPSFYEIMVAKDSSGNPLVFLQAENEDLARIVRDLFEELELEFHIFEELEGTATLSLAGASLDQVLKNLFKGSKYTYRNDQGVYLLGPRDMEGLRRVAIVNLKYRPTEKVIELMPQALKEGVELKEFVELNRIIISGSSERIQEIQEFIGEIDRPVPMVKIEMMVVDVDFNRLLQTGIKAGILQAGDSASAAGSLFPGLDYALDGNALNAILATSGVPALANLGNLSSNFYVQLQAQESRGLLKVVTRPVISTLNGNEASITIGQTDYYRLETNTASNGAVNSFNQVSQRFETIEINTTIKVKPQVSHDGMVTLELSPDFTSPGAQADPNIPPTILTRSFQSTIRVKDGETVVLGGLSRESQSNSTDGLPLLARLPVLKWIFGQNSRNKAKSSLIIYITPTIYYN